MNKKDIPERLFLMMKVALAQLVLRGCMKGRKVNEVTDGITCRDCKKWEVCECGKKGHENGTSIGYSIGECKEFEVNEVKGDKE